MKNSRKFKKKIIVKKLQTYNIFLSWENAFKIFLCNTGDLLIRFGFNKIWKIWLNGIWWNTKLFFYSKAISKQETKLILKFCERFEFEKSAKVWQNSNNLSFHVFFALILFTIFFVAWDRSIKTCFLFHGYGKDDDATSLIKFEMIQNRTVSFSSYFTYCNL